MSLLLTTPSGGLNEVLRALYLARGHDGNLVDPSRLIFRLGDRTSLADILSVLNGAAAPYVTSSNGKYGLTAAGVIYARAHKPGDSRVSVI